MHIPFKWNVTARVNSYLPPHLDDGSNVPVIRKMPGAWNELSVIVSPQNYVIEGGTISPYLNFA